MTLFTDHLTVLQKEAEQALSECGYTSLVIGSGHPHTHFLDDTHYAFRANPHFIRWVPFLHEAPDCWVIIRHAQRPLLLIHAPADFWHQSTQLPTDEWCNSFDIQLIEDTEALNAALEAVNGMAVIAEAEASSVLMVNYELNPSALINALHFDRAIKTEWEIDCLAKANLRAVKGHRAAEKGFYQGKSEFSLHQSYLEATQHSDHELPYNVIMALNEHAAILHYQHKQSIAPKQVRTLLLDGGASYLGYAADITRTWSNTQGLKTGTAVADGEFFESVIQRVDALNLAVIEQVKPGKDFLELHKLTHALLLDVLVDMGFVMERPSDSADSEMISRTFFPHGLGHLLGIQTHDVGGWQYNRAGDLQKPPESHPFLRLTRTLQEGMVITIEPGLYFIPMLLSVLKSHPAGRLVDWDLVERMIPWGGVRIEDNIVVTGGGCRNLTREAFEQVL